MTEVLVTPVSEVLVLVVLVASGTKRERLSLIISGIFHFSLYIRYLAFRTLRPSLPAPQEAVPLTLFSLTLCLRFLLPILRVTFS